MSQRGSSSGLSTVRMSLWVAFRKLKEQRFIILNSIERSKSWQWEEFVLVPLPIAPGQTAISEGIIYHLSDEVKVLTCKRGDQGPLIAIEVDFGKNADFDNSINQVNMVMFLVAILANSDGK